MAGKINFGPSALWPTPSNGAALVIKAGSNNMVVGYAFDGTTDEGVTTEAFKLIDFGSGTFTVKIDWYADTATSGNAVLEASFQCQSSGDAQSVETDGFATASTVVSACNGTADGPKEAVITGVANDSAADGDTCVLKIRRLPTNGSDNMTGDLIIRSVTIEYS
jgi:hypothetical protein